MKKGGGGGGGGGGGIILHGQPLSLGKKKSGQMQ